MALQKAQQCLVENGFLLNVGNVSGVFDHQQLGPWQVFVDQLGHLRWGAVVLVTHDHQGRGFDFF